MGNCVIKAKNIKKTFERADVKTEVVRGIDLEIAEGEFVAIVGESGSGKSTLLYLLSGSDKTSEGVVELFGKNLEEASDDELARMRRQMFSFVYQYDNLVSNLTAYENIVLPLMLDKKNLKDEEERISELIDYLNIKNCVDKFPKELSGGEQQRVALARALAIEPSLIFLDEPTGSLDTTMGKQVMELLKDINEKRNVALVMVTHSKAHAAYASRILEMADGKIAG
ncbi:MAG: ABC transporter ATP-binding protein [Clostridia bacterium]|nr:ABC transporter ATP-binding protein [Clostridia bacterium]